MARDRDSTRLRSRRFVGLAALALVAGCSASAEQPRPADEPSVRPGINERFLSEDLDVEEWTARFEVESREIYAERQAIVASLGLAPGMEVADVGAGTGLFLAPFANAVGASGAVYAVEISPRFLDHLRERAREEGLAAVHVVEGTERSVELAEASVDLAFACDVYHHFEYPQASLASLKRAIRPGGELVVIDFRRIPGKSSDFILKHVRDGQEVFTREIEQAGFVLVEEIAIDGLDENYALRFRRPQARAREVGRPARSEKTSAKLPE
jgi:SAM-dependent methyltransferase